MGKLNEKSKFKNRFTNNIIEVAAVTVTIDDFELMFGDGGKAYEFVL